MQKEILGNRLRTFSPIIKKLLYTVIMKYSSVN